MNSIITIEQRCADLIKQHGGLRPAARAIGMKSSYFFRLKSGHDVLPSKRVLKKLGLARNVTYHMAPDEAPR